MTDKINCKVCSIVTSVMILICCALAKIQYSQLQDVSARLRIVECRLERICSKLGLEPLVDAEPRKNMPILAIIEPEKESNQSKPY